MGEEGEGMSTLDETASGRALHRAWKCHAAGDDVGALIYSHRAARLRLRTIERHGKSAFLLGVFRETYLARHREVLAWIGSGRLDLQHGDLQ